MSLLGSIMGMNVYSNQNLGSGQMGMAQQNAYQSPSQSMLAQQQMAYTNALSQGWANLVKNQHKYMINGRTMNFDDFVNELCPDPEDPMRTFLTLKYQGMESK